MNNYSIVYQSFIDVHKRNNEPKFEQYAFEDTANAMVKEESITLVEAQERLSSIVSKNKRTSEI